MKKIFLEKYFPASRVAKIRKEICGIRQSYRKTLSEYWERFEQLCIQCPHHQIPDQLLIQYFYEGLMPTDRSIIDTTGEFCSICSLQGNASNMCPIMQEDYIE